MQLEPTDGPAKVTLTQGETRTIEKARLLVTALAGLVPAFWEEHSAGPNAIYETLDAIVAAFGSPKVTGASEEPAEAKT
jgi:hypothetical protein